MKSTSLLVPRSRKVRQHKIGCFGQRWQRVVCTCVKTRNTQLLSNLPYHDCNRYRNLSTLNVSLFLNYLASMFLLILGGIIMLIIFTKEPILDYIFCDSGKGQQSLAKTWYCLYCSYASSYGVSSTCLAHWSMAVFDGGSGGLIPLQEVADPQKVLQNLFWGSTLTPLRTPRFHFLAKPVYLCTTIRRLRLYRDGRDLI